MGFGVWGLGFGVWGLGFGVWGLGFGVWGLGWSLVWALKWGAPFSPLTHLHNPTVHTSEPFNEGKGPDLPLESNPKPSTEA